MTKDPHSKLDVMVTGTSLWSTLELDSEVVKGVSLRNKHQENLHDLKPFRSEDVEKTQDWTREGAKTYHFAWNWILKNKLSCNKTS